MVGFTKNTYAYLCYFWRLKYRVNNINNCTYKVEMGQWDSDKKKTIFFRK